MMIVEPESILIEGNVNDSLSSVKDLVARLAPLSVCGQGSSFRLDLSKLRYLGPDGATMISGSVLEARSRGVSAGVVWPAGAGPLRAFIEFAGMRHLLDNADLPDLADPVNVTIPLRQFSQSLHSDANPILELLGRFGEMSLF